MRRSGEHRSLIQAEGSGFDAVRPLASSRFDRAHQQHIFDRFDWIEPLHRLCMAESAPHIVCANEADMEAWLFLADTGERRRTAIANWYSFAFRPVFVGDPDSHARSRLIESIAREMTPHVAHIDLYPVLADDGTSALLVAAFRKAGWIAVARPYGVNHYLDVAGRSFADYWAARPGQLRSTVRRKERATALTFTIETQLTDALWDDYVAVYRRSWKPSEPNLDFLREMADAESRAGALRLGFARDHGAAVATQLWTVENSTALIHKLAHDQGADEASPGTLLSHYMFRHIIDRDHVATIDYGTGDNPYKREWMEQQRALYRLDFFNPRFTSAWLPAARAAISALVG